MRYLALFILVGCATTPPTPKVVDCGLIYAGKATYWNNVVTSPVRHMHFDAFRAELARVLPALQAITGDPRLPLTCELVRGWSVVVIPMTDWYSPEHQDVISGVTHCHLKRITINDDIGFQTSLAHELVHAAQNCTPIGQRSEDEDDDHAGWKATGIQPVLDRLESGP